MKPTRPTPKFQAIQDMKISKVNHSVLNQTVLILKQPELTQRVGLLALQYK
jgi:hypothetical protein